MEGRQALQGALSFFLPGPQMQNSSCFASDPGHLQGRLSNQIPFHEEEGAIENISSFNNNNNERQNQQSLCSVEGAWLCSLECVEATEGTYSGSKERAGACGP